jgi:hypothetical protein
MSVIVLTFPVEPNEADRRQNAENFGSPLPMCFITHTERDRLAAERDKAQTELETNKGILVDLLFHIRTIFRVAERSTASRSVELCTRREKRWRD